MIFLQSNTGELSDTENFPEPSHNYTHSKSGPSPKFISQICQSKHNTIPFKKRNHDNFLEEDLTPSNFIIQKCSSYTEDFKGTIGNIKESNNKTFQKSKFADKLIGLQKVRKALKFQLQKNKKRWHFSSFLNVIFLIQTFIQKLKNISPLRKADKLEKYQLRLISDEYDFEKEEEKKGSFVLDPSKGLSIFFDFIVLFALSFYFVTIPLQLVYNIFDTILLIKQLEILAMCFIFLDVLRNFNTAFYFKGKLVYSYSKIALHYIKDEFFLEIFSLLPILIPKSIYDESQKVYYNYFLFFVFFKLRRFGKLFRRLEGLLFAKSTFHHALSLIKLIIRIIFISHIFACIWNYMGLIGNQFFGESWIISKNLLDSSSQIQYLYSYYFVCITMNTVGFGDITPTNSMEIVFCIIFIFFACGMFAYSINSIGIILSDISKQENEFRKDLNIVNDFMGDKKISFDLQMRVRKYLEYIRREEKLKRNEATMQTIAKLSDSLREELLLEANGAILKEIKLFSSNFTEETLRRTIMIMKEKRYMPGDLIIQKGEMQENTLFIIKNGEVELFIGNADSSKTVQTYRQGEFFGEVAFFSGKEQNFSVRSIDFTNIFTISKIDFLSVVSKNVKDLERFNEIKDQVILYSDCSKLQKKCFSCKNLGHSIEKCPFMHFSPNKHIILNRHVYSINQERKANFFRRIKKDSNSFASWKKNKNTAENIQETLKHNSNFSNPSYIDNGTRELYEDDIDSDDDLSKEEDELHVFLNSKTKSIESQESLNLIKPSNKKRFDSSSYKLRESLKDENPSENENEYENNKENLSNWGTRRMGLRPEDKYSMKNNDIYGSLIIKQKNNLSLFGVIDFDQFANFSHYFPQNNLSQFLRKMEIKRLGILKKKRNSRKLQFNSSCSNSPIRNFALIHSIDKEFIHEGNIKIAQKPFLKDISNLNTRTTKFSTTDAMKQKEGEETDDKWNATIIRKVLDEKRKTHCEYLLQRIKKMWKRIRKKINKSLKIRKKNNYGLQINRIMKVG